MSSGALCDRGGVITATDSRPPSAGALLTCRECWGEFAWDSSPDLARCEWCAELNAWREGTTTPTNEVLRLSAGRRPTEA